MNVTSRNKKEESKINNKSSSMNMTPIRTNDFEVSISSNNDVVKEEESEADICDDEMDE
jgi:hypothetical protein